MKKNYYIPATEVVAFVGGMLMDTASPTNTLNPSGTGAGEAIDPSLGGQG